MQQPNIPENDKERLEALHTYDLLNQVQNAEFDEIVEFVVFYAGFPLYTSDDFPIGTLCVIDRKPKILTARQQKALELLSKQIMRLFELRKSVKEAATREKVLKQAVKGLEESTAIVTHDLKTSLRNIEISTELLVKKNAKNLDEHCQEYLKIIQKETSESIRFINDILKYSRSTYVFSINKELVDTHQLLDEIFTKLKIPTHFKVKMASDLPAIYTSHSTIQHIFENLIQNSIKYMDKEQPLIEINYSLEEEKYHTFKVKDNGGGIPKTRQKAIFTIFDRAQREEEQNSFGVGLATVHRLLTLLEGKIQVDSEIDKGTCFTFQIPITDDLPS